MDDDTFSLVRIQFVGGHVDCYMSEHEANRLRGDIIEGLKGWCEYDVYPKDIHKPPVIFSLHLQDIVGFVIGITSTPWWNM